MGGMPVPMLMKGPMFCLLPPCLSMMSKYASSEGLLNPKPPSLNVTTPGRLPFAIWIGRKYVGAAEVARATCQMGKAAASPYMLVVP